MTRWAIVILGALLGLLLASIGFGRAIEARVRADLPATARPPASARLVAYERGWLESSFEAEWTQPAGPRIGSRVRVVHGPIPWAAAFEDAAALLPAAAWIRSEIQIDAADGSQLGRIPRLPPVVATTRVGLSGRNGRVVIAAYEAPLMGDAILRAQPVTGVWEEGPGAALRGSTNWPGLTVTSGTSGLELEGFESAFETPDWRSPVPLGSSRGGIAALRFGMGGGSLASATAVRFRDERRVEAGQVSWSSRLEADEVAVLGQRLANPVFEVEVERLPVALLDAWQGRIADLLAAGHPPHAGDEARWQAELDALRRQLALQQAPPRLRAALSGTLDAGSVALDARAWLASTARLDPQAIEVEAELSLPASFAGPGAGAPASLGLLPGGGLLGIAEVWSPSQDGRTVSATLRIREGRTTLSGMPFDFLQRLAEERSRRP